ncbi:hypothetical protein A2290_06465 [candidate division WOR-1 bacterium RIFOXYB2_FULL_36_35]|uniref:Uncharacterized protein n=1 Tax=candidate division WOR-1 bacterium RIFOXYB2_FULL_36_35 TaxID=1802578 RepID=A0A1F4S0M9_UNCSA|nr:MAG: hypothetical protein A2290_06465 [candidate division WOR-1 bacterium RIFOXYB2_FULL_36_35]
MEKIIFLGVKPAYLFLVRSQYYRDTDLGRKRILDNQRIHVFTSQFAENFALSENEAKVLTKALNERVVDTILDNYRKHEEEMRRYEENKLRSRVPVYY